jgi:hypothetical protein
MHSSERRHRAAVPIAAPCGRRRWIVDDEVIMTNQELDTCPDGSLMGDPFSLSITVYVKI